MKIIHQIYISNNNAPPSEYVTNQMQKLKSMYSDYEYTLYNNEMCRNQIQSLLGEDVVKLYDSLNAYAYRSDLARYCILYQHGGFYFDSVICPEFKLEFDNFPVMYRAPIESCNGRNSIENGVMYFNKPKHPFLRNALKLCLKNINQKSYGLNPLDITGPTMLGRLQDYYDIRFGQSKLLDLDQQAVYSTQKAAYFEDVLHWLYKPDGFWLSSYDCIGTNSYDQMWHDKQIFTQGTK